MNTLIQFSVQDLMIFLIFTFIIIALIALISILWKIKKSIKTMPDIIENVGQISNEVKEITEKLNAIEMISDKKKDNPGFIDYLHIIEEVVQIIYRTFSSNK